MGDDPGRTAAAPRLPVGGRVVDRLGAVGEVDRFTIDLAAGQTYVLEVGGTGLSGGVGNPNLRLVGADGRVLRADDDSGLAFDARIEHRPTVSGAYVLEVGGTPNNFGFSTTGAYALEAAVYDPARDDALASPLTTDRLAVGGVRSGRIEEWGDVDWYGVDLTFNQVYRVTLTGTVAGVVIPEFTLYSVRGTLLTESLEDPRMMTFFADSTERYHIGVDGGTLGRTGPYRLALQPLGPGRDDYSLGPENAGRLAVGGARAGGNLVPNAVDLKDEDWFAVGLKAGTSYTFDVQSTWGDPLIAARDAAGTVLTVSQDANPNDGYESVTFTAAKDGTYHAAVSVGPYNFVTLYNGGTYTVGARRAAGGSGARAASETEVLTTEDVLDLGDATGVGHAAREAPALSLDHLVPLDPPAG